MSNYNLKDLAFHNLLAIVLCGSLVFSNCKNRNSSRPETTEVESATFTTQGIDKDSFQKLLQAADHIDIMFNFHQASINIDGRQGVLQDLQYLSSKPLKEIPTKCQPVARKIYLANGEIIMEADLYSGENCNFHVFIKNGVELYGNYMTTPGVLHVEEILKKVAAGPYSK